MAEESLPALRMPGPRLPPSAAVLAKPVDLSTHVFVEPTKQIKSPNDIPRWLKSEAYADLLGFINAMNKAIMGRARSDCSSCSEEVERLVGLLDTLTGWVEQIPAVDEPARFGNTAYRDWNSRLVERADEVLLECLGEKFRPAVLELKIYLLDSFGNATRIDYGTGHEMAFVTLLCCLFKLGALQESDSQAVIFKVFHKYLVLCRLLQMTYRMEPAGSQGVWSLDDFQFLPFLWGAAQLIDNIGLVPSKSIQPETFSRFADDYLFMEAVQHIHKVKTGPFHEHSNALWNISGVPMWTKVNSGLMKMYMGEVLPKFPIIQHYFFGSLMSLKPQS